MEKRVLELIAFFQAENFRSPEVMYLNKFDLLVLEGEILRSIKGFKINGSAKLSTFHGIEVKESNIPQGEILIG